METYLVMFKLREESYGGSAEEAAYILTDKILPSLEALSRMEKDGQVIGGFFEGQRSGTFFFKAEDDNALDKIFDALPMMAAYDVEAVPIQSIDSALERDKRIVENVAKAAGL